MKNIKKLLAVVVAMTMALMLAVPAFAATVSVPEGDRADHAYVAYQIFTGDQTDDSEVLSNIAWGNGIKSADFVSALQDDETYGSKFTDKSDAADIAKVLSDNNTNTALANRVAELAYANKADAENGIPLTAGTTELDDGYYLIVDESESVESGDAYNKAMLQVTGNINITDKTDAPEITKQILDTNKTGTDSVSGMTGVWEDTNNASIGDTIAYKLQSAVPDMSRFNQYYFIMHDTMSAGLTYGDIVSVSVGDKTLTKDVDYTVAATVNTDKTTTLEIVFNNFIQYAGSTNAAVIVTYTATLNADAVIGIAGNPNEVYLEYSNNPNEEGSGENKPGDNDNVTGETPHDWVETYVTEININKVDDNDKPLTGAEFTLTGDKVNKVKVTTNTFAESNDGAYYKLATGAFTKTAPTEATSAQYASTTQKYAPTETTTWNTTTETVSAVATVGADGTLKFTGLGEGTYTLSETKTPAGYNTIADQTIVISCSEKDIVTTGAPETCEWSYTLNGNTNNDTFKIVNVKGATLPSTGGMGTTLFTIVGLGLMVGAAVLLIAKRRVNK